LIGEAYDSVGEHYYDQGDFTSAIKQYKIALTLATKHSNRPLIEKILQHISGAYYMLRKSGKATEFLLAALEINKLTGNKVERIAELTNLAILKNMLKQHQESEQYIAEAMTTAEEVNSIPLHAIVLTNSASFLLDTGNFRMSIEVSKRCLEVLPIDKYPQNHRTRIVLELNLATAYTRLGEYSEAKEYLTHVSKAAEDIEDLELIIQCKLLWMELHWAAGVYAETERIAKEALKLCRKHKMFDKMIRIQESLARKYETAHKVPQCIATYKSMMKVFRKQQLALQDTLQEKCISISVHNYGSEQQTRLNVKNEIGNSSGGQVEVFVGQSSMAESIRNQINIAAQNSTVNVLITGESGTGKEVVANMIHKLSSRSRHPMIAINTAAIPSSLMESELFGYKKGAFTNAYIDSQGIFQRAHLGTVFLDEISEMPFDLQVKLLRVLEVRKVTPLGGNKEIPFNCRIISSTNRDLQSMVIMKLFRLDLMHRLNTFVINIPPLRDRPEDISVLVKYYVSMFAAEMVTPRPIIKSSFLNALTRYSFPGNVRELVNIVQRMMILYQGTAWSSEQLKEIGIIPASGKPGMALKERFHKAERDEIIEALQKAGGKQKAAAIILGYSESTLCQRIVQYGIKEYTQRGN
jgi:DNA-binding NtrC family response regulator